MDCILPVGAVSFIHEGTHLAYVPATGAGFWWSTARSTWCVVNDGVPTTTSTYIQANGGHIPWLRVVAQYFLNGGAAIDVRNTVKHISGVYGWDGHDRLSNLCIAPRTCAKNGVGISSKFQGVGWSKSSRKWVATARDPVTGKKRQYIGTFTDEREAAQAYVNFCTQHGLPCGPAIEALKLAETDYRQLN